MNSRIKELDKQAYQWAISESKGGPNICAPGSDYFLAMEKKKFAELIVKECANIAFDEYAATDGADSGESAILKHFGVEDV